MKISTRSESTASPFHDARKEFSDIFINIKYISLLLHHEATYLLVTVYDSHRSISEIYHSLYTRVNKVPPVSPSLLQLFQ